MMIDEYQKILVAYKIGKITLNEAILVLKERKEKEREIRISLDQEDFETLIGGGIVDSGNIKILLKDIGYRAMLHIINNAERQDGK